MSEMMRPLPFDKLMTWALEEYRSQGRIFGIQKEKFYQPAGEGLRMFGDTIATPVGPAAGPNAQLAQNLVASYLAGSRFLELKTVQKMDGAELAACVPRPCINCEDEGYNVEWSTELTVAQAYEEYVKGYLAILTLGKELGLSTGRDFIFNMSVGYDLEGIQTPKIDSFIEGLKDASAQPVYQESLAWLKANLGRFEHLTEADLTAISPRVSNSVTLSTLHGCPPQEIERIAKYLLAEKGLHTYVKCNPTLLGYKFAREILDRMGYGYISFDEHHFQNDLQYADAVAMLQRLMAHAAERELAFGVKLTNTFPVQIKRNELPGEEMYTSGRALFPLSINVARKLAEDFDGRLPISYSGGADAFNIEDIFACGIQPITVATTILKPGGYERLPQLATLLQPLQRAAWPGVDVAAVQKLAERVPELALYCKEARPVGSRKTAKPLGLFDCFMAPCKEGGCPIEQQIPEYLSLVALEQYEEAFALIAVDNTAPSITGEICNHNCQNKCTRLDYEGSLAIRQAKRLAAEAAQDGYLTQITAPPLRKGGKVGVVGAGPAGLAAAVFLRRQGLAVTVLEQREKPYGMVQYVIPAFRISDQAIQRDYQLAQRLGVEFRFGVTVRPEEIAGLRQQYDYLILATGAWGASRPAVNTGAAHTRDALQFLEESKAHDCQVELGKRVAVIGGGDVAMDCARAAKRAPGVEEVTIVYRRTREFMPAQPEEIHEALAEEAGLIELLAPRSYDGKTLVCEQMRLGDWDASGRRGIEGTGVETSLPFDSVINATGARVDYGYFEQAGVVLDDKTVETNMRHVYIAGDCKNGPATVVQAIADAKQIAITVLRDLGMEPDFRRADYPQDQQKLAAKKGVLKAARPDHLDADRCLVCDQLCELCCDVCPNRANVRLLVEGFGEPHQILHLDGFCNECGNCGVFCPHAGDPYKDKFTLFWSEEDFRDSANRGFYKLAEDQYLLRLTDGTEQRCGLEQAPAEYAALIRAVEERYAYYLL